MRLMVLGGGGCQINLIRRAKSEGHFIILVDYLPDCPGCALADMHLQISTFDTESVLRAAEELKIEGIVTTGTDQPVYTAAVVAQTLGLRFYIDSDTAKAVTNKRVMKHLFQRYGIPNVDFRLIGQDFTDDEIAGLHFPAVLKPVDSQGQRGIFLVGSVMEVRQHISVTLSFSREDKVLLEEYYESDEITVNGWVTDGKTTIISVVDRVTIKNTNHIGICLCHNYPSVHLKKYYDRIEAVTELIVSSLNLRNGPIYFQYLIGRDGLKVNEIAMRIGGAYEDITIPIISGIDILGMLLQSVQHATFDASPLLCYNLKHNKKFVSTQMFFCRPGRVRYITPKEQMLKLDGVLDISYAIGEDSTIGTIENATARAGYIIIEGSSFADMIDRINKTFEFFQVLGESGGNLVIKYKDYPGKYTFANGFE